MATGTPLGTVTGLWRYPIKALAPEALERVAVDADGLAGDRRSALFVKTPEHARTGKTYRGKEHQLLHTVATVPQAIELGAERSLDLDVLGDGPYFDARPVSIVFDTWVFDVERMAGTPVEALRFRPNILVRGVPGFALSESDFVGKSLAIGGVRMTCGESIIRCVTTSYDLETGESQGHVLRAIVNGRGNVVGIYCRVDVPGELALGDTLTLVSNGAV